MKLFETAINNFMFLGLTWDERSEKYSYTEVCFVCPFVGVLSSISCLLFIIYDAETFYEYGLTFTVLSAAIGTIIICIVFIFEVHKFNKFIEICQNMVEKSKSIHLFHIIFTYDSVLIQFGYLDLQTSPKCEDFSELKSI